MDIDIIKATDIKVLIEKETNLRFKKNTLEKCPFCNSGGRKNGTSAFSVKPKDNIFKCFSCGKKGNPIDFVKYYKKLKNGDAVKYMYKNYGGAVNPPAPEPESEKSKTRLKKAIWAIKNNAKDAAKEYLKSRAIVVNDIKPTAFYFDKLSNAVCFIDQKEQLINKRFIVPEIDKPKAIMSAGSKIKNALYTETYKAAAGKVFITEGAINALSLHPYSAIALFTSDNLFSDVKFLSKYLKNKKVILAFDSDEAGEKAAEYYTDFILKNIPVKTLSRLNFPPDQDANDLLKDKVLKEFLINTDNYDFIKINEIDRPLRQYTEEPEEFFYKHQFFVKGSKYYIRKSSKESTQDILISDCVFDFMYRLDDGTQNQKRLIKIQQEPISGNQRIQILELTAEDLKKDKFETILRSNGFSYLGTKPTLDRITMYLMHREKISEIIETLGQQEGSELFVFSNLAINTNGELLKPNSIGMFTHKNKTYYLPTASPANEKNPDLKEMKKMKYTAGNIDFAQFADLFYQSNKLNGSIGIMFYILALFRDVVFDHLDFFPYLYLYGLRGAGKSSYVDFLLALFGDESKGHALKNISQAALSRIASQKRNAITYYKEYAKDAPEIVEDYLKTGYDGQSRTIGMKTTGTETKSFEIMSAGIIDSNYLPTGSEAVFTRMIILDFEYDKFTEEQTEAYEALKEIEKKEGLAQITKEIYTQRGFFADNFKDVYYGVLSEVKTELGGFELPERSLKHVALILSAYQLISPALNFPFDYEELRRIMFSHAHAQNMKLNEFSTTAVFWQALATAKQDDKLKKFQSKDKSGRLITKNEAHYRINEKDRTIRLKSSKLAQMHAFYAQYCKTINITPDSLTELKSKLISEGYTHFLPNQQQSRSSKTTTDAYLSSVYCFGYNYEKDSIILENQEIDL